jgi:hypothetical protein
VCVYCFRTDFGECRRSEYTHTTHTHTHTHTHTPTHSLTQTHTPTLSLSLSHTHTPSDTSTPSPSHGKMASRSPGTKSLKICQTHFQNSVPEYIFYTKSLYRGLLRILPPVGVSPGTKNKYTKKITQSHIIEDF